MYYTCIQLFYEHSFYDNFFPLFAILYLVLVYLVIDINPYNIINNFYDYLVNLLQYHFPTLTLKR